MKVKDRTLEANDRLSIMPIDRSEPAIVALRSAYLHAYKMPEDSVSLATRFFGVRRGDGPIIAVLGERFDVQRNATEICDLYCEPSRDGVAARDAIIKLYKRLYDSGKRKTISFAVLRKNKTMNTKLQKIMPPRGHIYVMSSDPKYAEVN